MKSFETRTTWLIVIGLLVFAAVASAAWPAVANSLNLEPGLGGPGGAGGLDTELDGVPLPAVLEGLPGVDLIADDEGRISPWLVLAVIGGLVTGLIIGTGLVIGLLLRLLDRQTRKVKADPQFNEQAAALAQREKERLQQLARSQPPAPTPVHERPRWSLVATALIILFFVFLAGFALSDTFYGGGDVELFEGRYGNPALPLAGGMALVALLVLITAVRGRRSRVLDSDENAPVSWGMIWVVVSGLIFLGIGIGLTLAMRTVEAP